MFKKKREKIRFSFTLIRYRRVCRFKIRYHILFFFKFYLINEFSRWTDLSYNDWTPSRMMPSSPNKIQIPFQLIKSMWIQSHWCHLVWSKEFERNLRAAVCNGSNWSQTNASSPNIRLAGFAVRVCNRLRFPVDRIGYSPKHMTSIGRNKDRLSWMRPWLQ